MKQKRFQKNLEVQRFNLVEFNEGGFSDSVSAVMSKSKMKKFNAYRGGPMNIEEARMNMDLLKEINEMKKQEKKN